MFITLAPGSKNIVKNPKYNSVQKKASFFLNMTLIELSPRVNDINVRKSVFS